MSVVGIATVLAAGVTSAAEVEERFAVGVHASDGQFLSFVRTGEDNIVRFTSREDALGIIRVLNERHNNSRNGVPPAEARLYQAQ
jgi:hypothetical protein